MSDDQGLDDLRGQLDDIDERIVGLMAERQTTVARIRERKRSAGRVVFDRRREQQVVQHFERRASELGLPLEPVRALVEALFAASHALQAEAEGDERSLTQTKAKQRIAIVGGKGRMGRLFSRWFESWGHEVEPLEAVEEVGIRTADVVMLAVPMGKAAEVAAAVAPLVRQDALLCDINSLKEEVCEAMRATAGEAIGTHPLFGPTTQSLRRQKIVLCELSPGPRSRWLAQELGRMGAELIYTDPEAHDRMMAVVQVLTHFGIMTMGRSLSAANVPLERTLEFTSPIYRLELSIVGRLFSQDPALYAEIMMRNRHGEPLRARFVEEAQTLASELRDEDRVTFVERFERTRHFFRSFSEEAMDLSDQIIERLMSKP